jgi:predicted flap endonuclease-1-like 5' DNA nuclease
METAVVAAAIATKEPVAEVQEAAETAPTAVDLVEEAAQASSGASAKLTANTDFIEGIGPAYSQKLKDAGIATSKDLLEKGATRQGRQDLAEETGISSKLILTWIHAVDLYRIKGVGAEYADLLDKAGVNTVLELAQRNPDNLHEKLIEVNLEKHLVREVPSLSKVKDWIEQAAALPRVISY